MKWLWQHCYSWLSISLSVVTALFDIGSFKHWFWAVTVAPQTELSQRITWVHLSAACAAIALAGLAIKREGPRALPILAIIIAWLCLFIFGVGMAV
jgi:hypothetical protein